MNKSSLLSLILWIMLSGLTHSNCQTPVIIDVDISLKDEQNIQLSQFIDRAEMIVLEGKKGAYLAGLSWVNVGSKYIMIGGKQPSIVLLFGRDGKFLRQIGSEGKGPGEYNFLNAASMSPDEKFIILSDPTTMKLMSFNPNGRLIKEITLKDGSPSRIIEKISFIDNQRFAVLFRKPIKEAANYRKIQFYSTDLIPEKSILPITDPDRFSLKGYIQDELIANPTGLSYFDQLDNIVYQIDKDLVAEPIYQFQIRSPLTPEIFKDFNDSNQRAQMAKKTYLWRIVNTPGFLISHGNNLGKPILIVYDKTTHESSSVPVKNPCYRGGRKQPSIENDIFGIEPVYLDQYQTQSDFFIMNVSLVETSEWRDISCLKKLKLAQPGIRDKIVTMVENQTGAENMILVLLHLKNTMNTPNHLPKLPN